jgi:hypothetical protein
MTLVAKVVASDVEMIATWKSCDVDIIRVNRK